MIIIHIIIIIIWCVCVNCLAISKLIKSLNFGIIIIMSSFGYRIFEILLSFFIIVTFISINQIDCDDSSIEIRSNQRKLMKKN